MSDQMDIIKLIQDVSAEIRIEMGKISDKIDGVKDDVSKVKLDDVETRGKINSLELLQGGMIRDYNNLYNDCESIRESVKTVVFITKNPKLVKFTALGFVMTLVFSIFVSYKSVSEYITREDNGKNQTEQLRTE